MAVVMGTSTLTTEDGALWPMKMGPEGQLQGGRGSGGVVQELTRAFNWAGL